MELAVREKSAWIPSLLLSLSLAAMGVQAAPDDAGTTPERTDGSRMFIIGSTLMAPYIKDVIEHLSTNAGIPAAIMVNKGSARGVDAFCSGIGIQYPDVVAVSRRIRSVELDRCQANGVTDVMEIQVGYAATAIISRADDQTYPLTLNSLYRAIARELPEGSDFHLNTKTKWKDVDSRLPDTDIRFIVATPALGGRGFMEDRMLQQACRGIFEIKAIFNAEDRVKQCITLRDDGRIIELDAPYEQNVLKALQTSPPGTLAVVPTNFATSHLDVEKIQPLEGILPTEQTIADGSYDFVRPLYFYVKKAHVKNYLGQGPVAGLREFITEVTRESSVGPNGYMVTRGIFPMHDEMRASVRASALRLTPMVR